MRGCGVSNREGLRWSFKHFLEQFVVEVEGSTVGGVAKIEDNMRVGVLVHIGSMSTTRAPGLEHTTPASGSARVGTHQDAAAGTRRRWSARALVPPPSAGGGRIHHRTTT
jgi:hypothetical protein